MDLFSYHYIQIKTRHLYNICWGISGYGGYMGHRCTTYCDGWISVSDPTHVFQGIIVQVEGQRYSQDMDSVKKVMLNTNNYG